MYEERERDYSLSRVPFKGRRSFVFSFPPLTVSMTHVHHASPDSLNWVRHFRWLDPSKSLAASSSLPSSLPAALPCKGRVRKGYPPPPTLQAGEGRGRGVTNRVAFVFAPKRNRHFEFMIPGVYGARTPKNFGR